MKKGFLNAKYSRTASSKPVSASPPSAPKAVTETANDTGSLVDQLKRASLSKSSPSPPNPASTDQAKPLALASPADGPYRIVGIPGKGKGLVATRSFEVGEVVLAEKPAVRYTAQESCSTWADRVARLPTTTVLRSTTSTFRLRTINDFSTVQTSQKGVFLQASRLNHSCRRNLVYHWDAEKEVMTLTAAEKVVEGQELTTVYVKPTMKKVERQEQLRYQFGFVCECEVCSLSIDDAKTTDERRGALEQIFQQNYMAKKTSDPLQDLNILKFGLSIMHHDKIYPDRRNLAVVAAEICIFWGNREHAKEWLKRTLEYEAIEAGTTSMDYRSHAAILGALESNKRELPQFGCWGRKTLVGP